MKCSHTFSIKGNTAFIRVHIQDDKDFTMKVWILAIKPYSDILIFILKEVKNIICDEFVEDDIISEKY